MINWKQRQLDRYSVSIAFLTLVGLGVLIALTGAEGLQLTEVLRVLSVWGFAEELVFTSAGLIFLAFLAGRFLNRSVAVGGVVLLVLANSTTAGPGNLIPNYPTSPGTDRATLLELAESDPHVAISDEIPVILRMGEALGTTRLSIPLYELADRIRAFTDIEVVSEVIRVDFPVEDVPQLGAAQTIGRLGELPISVIGVGQEYVWLDAPGGVYIVATDLLPDSTS